MSKFLGQEFYALIGAIEVEFDALVKKGEENIKECILISITEESVIGVKNGLYRDIGIDSMKEILCSLNIRLDECVLHGIGKATTLLSNYKQFMRLNNKIILIPKKLNIQKFLVDGNLIESENLFGKSIYTIEEEGNENIVIEDIAEIIFLMNRVATHIVNKINEIGIVNKINDIDTLIKESRGSVEDKIDDTINILKDLIKSLEK